MLHMGKKYTMEIAGIKRELELFPINENTAIAAFIIFGDVELTERCAAELIKIAPEHDIIVTAEAKSIPLIHEMTRQLGRNEYVVARKSPKLYMENILKVNVNSITTGHEQMLCIGDREKGMIKGKRVLIADDVISTGDSLAAIEALVSSAGGKIVGKMAVLAEGDAIARKDITVLKPLPLFNLDGTVKE